MQYLLMLAAVRQSLDYIDLYTIVENIICTNTNNRCGSNAVNRRMKLHRTLDMNDCALQLRPLHNSKTTAVSEAAKYDMIITIMHRTLEIVSHLQGCLVLLVPECTPFL